MTISEGESFGVVDIIGSIYKEEKISINNWFNRKDLMKRQFSILSDTYTEIMSLSILDLNRIQVEFLEYYDQLIEHKMDLLHKLLLVKL